MLKESHLLLQLFGELVELVLCQHVLLLGGGDSLALVVVKASSLVLTDDLGRVIEEDSCGMVTQQVAKSILG